jgi:ubiquinone/menaquinone biosynthesis C-methylase UbiE
MNHTGHDIRLCKPGRLPFGDACFDTVLTITVLMHLTDKMAQQTADEMKRVLAKSGKLLLVESGVEGYRTQTDYEKLFEPEITIKKHGQITEKNEPLVILEGYKNGLRVQ